MQSCCNCKNDICLYWGTDKGGCEDHESPDYGSIDGGWVYKDCIAIMEEIARAK